MRTLLAFLLTAVTCLAADQSWRTPAQVAVVSPIRIQSPAANAAALRITGPATGQAGAPVTLVVTGLPAVDMDLPIGQQTRWIDLLRFDVSAPAGAVQTLDKELVMQVSPWTWKLRLTFTGDKPGCYVIVCDWNQEPYGLALHRVELGGGPVPPPDPPPDPPGPTPVTVSGLYVLTVHDPLKHGSLPQTQVDVFSSKQVRDWLGTNCARDAAGTPAYRFLRPGADVSKEIDPAWSQILALPHPGIADPYWVLVDADHGAIEPVPETVETALGRLAAFKAGG